MSAFDRRIIHHTLKDYPGIETQAWKWKARRKK